MRRDSGKTCAAIDLLDNSLQMAQVLLPLPCDDDAEEKSSACPYWELCAAHVVVVSMQITCPRARHDVWHGLLQCPLGSLSWCRAPALPHHPHG